MKNAGPNLGSPGDPNFGVRKRSHFWAHGRRAKGERGLLTPALGRLRPQNWGRQATPVLGPRFYTIVSIFRRKLVQVLGGTLLCKSATWTSSRTLMRPIRPLHHLCHAVPKPAIQFLALCPSVGVEPAQAAKRALTLSKLQATHGQCERLSNSLQPNSETA